MKRYHWTWTVLALGLSLASCTPKGSVPIQSKPTEPTPQSRSNPPPLDRPDPVRSLPPVRKFDESLLRGYEFLMQKRPPQVMVELRDTALGPLAIPRGAEYDIAQTFFEKFRQGTLDSAAFIPRWKDYLTVLCSRALAQGVGWDTCRIGKFQTLDEGGLFASVLLRQAKRHITGLIYLQKKEDHWLISDLQFSWSALAKATAPADSLETPAPVFDPESPQSLRDF